MTDIFTSEKRSELMSKIRSKWTAPEKKIHNYLKGHKIKHKLLYTSEVKLNTIYRWER